MVKTATYGKRDHNTDKILEEARVVDLENKSHWMEERQRKDPVGGILAKYVQEWEKIADPLVLKIVAQGLKLEFFTHSSISQRPAIVSVAKGTGQITGNFSASGNVIRKEGDRKSVEYKLAGILQPFFYGA